MIRLDRIDHAGPKVEDALGVTKEALLQKMNEMIFQLKTLGNFYKDLNLDTSDIFLLGKLWEEHDKLSEIIVEFWGKVKKREAISLEEAAGTVIILEEWDKKGHGAFRGRIETGTVPCQQEFN